MVGYDQKKRAGRAGNSNNSSFLIAAELYSPIVLVCPLGFTHEDGSWLMSVAILEKRYIITLIFF